MIIKALSKSPWGAGLVKMDIGSGDRAAQHNLQIPAHTSNRIIPPYLFPRNISQRSRLTSSRPDAILITPYKAKPTSCSPSSSAHTVRYAADTTPHRGPVVPTASDSLTNKM
eukprot:86090-Pelagomonas_calceolata.AAC.1